ncbi:unnamed protein product [Rotaria sordida]|uniref:Uncharacterized protein n=1 Tax=Rotaria sordida TaxID=392033 RepID=A0A814QGE3_9BILA|nr:unnamed protein product [Rotaria sordida]CAF1336509.1 unnamed protein product [Rotaria sordida]
MAPTTENMKNLFGPRATLPSLSDIYTTRINALQATNTNLREENNRLETYATEVNNKNHDLTVKVLELETQNLRVAFGAEILKQLLVQRLEEFEKKVQDLEARENKVQDFEELQKKVQCFEEFQKKFEEFQKTIDKENHDLKEPTSQIKSNLTKFKLSNRDVEKPPKEHNGVRLKAWSY